MSLAKVRSGEVEIAYDVRGDEQSPAIVLIPGLGGSMGDFDEDQVDELIDEGLRVIRIDNRDSGASTHLTWLGMPDLMSIFMGAQDRVPYRLEDMAADVLAVLDEIEVERVHVVGVSMGGMIAQEFVLAHPEMARSLASIMSTTGARDVGSPSPEVIQLAVGSVMGGAPLDPLEMMRRISSPGYPFDESRARARIEGQLASSNDPYGTLRQLAAVLGASDRTERLRALDLPATVIHGRDDPLINVSGGEATAAAIPGASLLVFEGMGHDVPEALWPEIRDTVLANVRRAEREGR
ncbi:MAG: alpha/beta fold hydrolase [Acidimicrobiales bacterium]